MKKIRGSLIWQCRDCRQSFALHDGYLTKLKMDRPFLERMVAVEQHDCRPPWNR